jgi:hypothetical protein
MLILACHKRKKKLLDILPPRTQLDVTDALIRMTKSSGKMWMTQSFYSGLKNHAFKKVIQTFVETDEAETDFFLEPLKGHFLGYLLSRYQDQFKWITPSVSLKEAIIMQHTYSTSSFFEYLIFRTGEEY